jgi:hypothetical protein
MGKNPVSEFLKLGSWNYREKAFLSFQKMWVISVTHRQDRRRSRGGGHISPDSVPLVTVDNIRRIMAERRKSVLLLVVAVTVTACSLSLTLGKYRLCAGSELRAITHFVNCCILITVKCSSRYTVSKKLVKGQSVSVSPFLGAMGPEMPYLEDIVACQCDLRSQ